MASSVESGGEIRLTQNMDREISWSQEDEKILCHDVKFVSFASSVQTRLCSFELRIWNEKLLKKRRSSRRIAEDEPPLPGEILDEDEVYQFLKIITDEQIRELDELGSDYGIASLNEELKASKREDETCEAKALALEEKRGDRGHKKKKNKALEYGAGKKRTSVGNSFTK
ncbi:hypothetical protein SeLEV6574_g08644 [Synchytrium endobioticum]|uniref:Uncharacterized protein n=1 Tax=Synchytrium endobioticum TaxID=286115 RepID=A0A507BVZ5_9FUNG|nr:hypothetical protein SeLEV6574_g08644 [Synchytrium endobioticum]